MSKTSIPSLIQKKQQGEKFAVVTCYDASFAQLVENAGIEAILVGDSLGMVLQGHDSTLPVSVDNMVYHTASVARGCRNIAVGSSSGPGQARSQRQSQRMGQGCCRMFRWERRWA